MNDFDLLVIGAGSGGVRAGRLAATGGARVGVIEEAALGGTCVNVGCIPKKLLVYASHVAEDLHDAESGYGHRFGPREFDWPTLIANKNREIERLNRIYGDMLDKAGAERIEGRAVFEDAHTLRVGDRTLRAETILVATGGRPRVPDFPGAELAITSNEAFFLEELPRRALVVGGGYIAVEFAGIFHGLGVDVTQLYRGPLFLRGFDDDVRAHLAEQMRAKKIDVRFDLNVVALDEAGTGVRATLTDGSTLDADLALFATGRIPNTGGLGLEKAGVEVDAAGAVQVDEYSRTNVEHIYAIGDVTNRIQLTPVAINEGIAFVETRYRNNPTPVDHTDVPSAVFSQPPIGSVGLTEAEARERHGEIDVYRSTFRALKHTLVDTSERTLMKLLVDRASDRVVGLHMVGPDAGEIVQGFAVAVKLGATKRQFDATVAVHPTSAEEFVTMREPVS